MNALFIITISFITIMAASAYQRPMLLRIEQPTKQTTLRSIAKASIVQERNSAKEAKR